MSGLSKPRPVRFTHGKGTRLSSYTKLGGTQGRSGWALKISLSLGFDPRTVHVVAIRYTDGAIPAHLRDIMVSYIYLNVCLRSRVIHSQFMSHLRVS
jgi:hypothetical protein